MLVLRKRTITDGGLSENQAKRASFAAFATRDVLPDPLGPWMTSGYWGGGEEGGGGGQAGGEVGLNGLEGGRAPDKVAGEAGAGEGVMLGPSSPGVLRSNP